MLNFIDPSTRRSFLRVGSMALGGLSLPQILSAQSVQNQLGGSLKDKSVVFLFMHGGPSQFETFDPKMGAPSEIRSATGEVKTSLPGVTFGGTLTKLAKQAHRCAIVRSFSTGDGNHDIKPIVGKESLGANLGSLYARVAGMTRADSGMPTNVALLPNAVDPEAQPGEMSFGKFNDTGSLGPAYAPFMPGSSGDLQEDMAMHLSRGRLDDRRALLTQLDDLKRTLDVTGNGGFSRFQEQAFETLIGGVSDAFDLTKEDPMTLARYDTRPIVHPDSIRKVWNNHKNYRDHGQSLGHLMLLARRLCERGCGFVTVTTNFVWDMHADVNNATMTEGMQYVGQPFDHAVSTFIDDVHERGLSDKILLVACGEMGRTPKLNAKGGRDHWGKLAPLLLSGGGLEMGQVIGDSTRDGGEANTDGVTTQHLLATIMHTLFDVSELRLIDHLPRDVARLLTGGEPIPRLFV
ncbi:MAG: hypothetical protein ACI8T1_000079 [Verrucomicrobiales bacterium]|jgi:hypothetical protein